MILFRKSFFGILALQELWCNSSAHAQQDEIDTCRYCNRYHFTINKFLLASHRAWWSIRETGIANGHLWNISVQHHMSATTSNEWFVEIFLLKKLNRKLKSHRRNSNKRLISSFRLCSSEHHFVFEHFTENASPSKFAYEIIFYESSERPIWISNHKTIWKLKRSSAKSFTHSIWIWWMVGC